MGHSVVNFWVVTTNVINELDELQILTLHDLKV